MIAGPTASGKSDLAVSLGQRLSAQIVSADSRQVYRELNVGVAKPTARQLAAVPHHLVGYVSIHEPYSAGRWAADARHAIETSFGESRTVIVAGGSGLHVRALVEGIPDMPHVPREIRDGYDEAFRQNGLPPLVEELRRRDPAYHAVVDRQNPRRVLRALSAMAASRITFTELRARPASPLPYPMEWLILDPPRERLYAAVERRVDGMLADGLEREARALYPHRGLDALQTIGYREWWPYLDGDRDRARTVGLIKQATRNYARRQLTWNRKLPGTRLARANPDDALRAILGL